MCKVNERCLLSFVLTLISVLISKVIPHFGIEVTVCIDKNGIVGVIEEVHESFDCSTQIYKRIKSGGLKVIPQLLPIEMGAMLLILPTNVYVVLINFLKVDLGSPEREDVCAPGMPIRGMLLCSAT